MVRGYSCRLKHDRNCAKAKKRSTAKYAKYAKAEISGVLERGHSCPPAYSSPVNMRARMPALLRLPFCRFDFFTKFAVWDFRLLTSAATIIVGFRLVTSAATAHLNSLSAGRFGVTTFAAAQQRPQKTGPATSITI